MAENGAEEKGQTKARRGKKGVKARRRKNSIKSKSKKENKRKEKQNGKKRVAPNTKLNPDQDKLT